MDFGISLDPSSISQRHCLEDSDEEDDDSKESDCVSSTFKLPDQSEKLPPGANLIIAIGQPAVVFTKSNLDLEPLPSCTMSTDLLTVFKDKHFPTGSARHDNLYTVSEGFTAKCSSSSSEKYLVCTHEQLLNSQYCNLWCSKVIELFQPKLVLILMAERSYQFLSCHPQELNGDHLYSTLRCLQSTSWPLKPLATFLEAPNTVIGEAAAGLTHCQVHGVAAALVVCYTADSTQSLAERAAAFQPVLRHSLFQGGLVVKSEEEAAQRSRKLVPRVSEDLSNLYT